MNILVLGAGAIGSTVGGYLSGAGHDVVLADGWEDHVRAMSQSGLRVSGVRGDHVYRVQAIPYEQVCELQLVPDVVFISVKSFDTEAVLELVTPLVGPRTLVVSTQNGLNEELLVGLFGAERVIGCVTELGGYLQGPGHAVEHRKEGGFVIGVLGSQGNARISDLANLMGRCAPIEMSGNIWGVLWSKLLWNCMLNPLSAIMGVGQGHIIVNDVSRQIALAVAAEATAVAAACGVRLEPLTFLGIDPSRFATSDPAERAAVEEGLIRRYRNQLDKSTSMLQDVQKGRKTEIDFLNGYVVSKGRQLGLTTPVNENIVHLVHAIERGSLRPDPALLAELRS